MLTLPLLLFLLSVPQPKDLSPDIPVSFHSAISAVPPLVSLALVVQSFVRIMAKRVTSCEAAEHQPKQLVKLLERVSVRPATVVEKSDITSETTLRQQQLATLEES